MTDAVPSHRELANQAKALKAQGRLDDAIAVYNRAVALFPNSAVAQHNLAAALGDAARYVDAERRCRLAFAKGLDAPETWLVLARALQGQGRLDEAEQAYRDALRRRSVIPDALRDLSQLIWMRTGNLAAATAPLDDSIRAEPMNPSLRLIKAKALEYAGDFVGAYEASREAARLRDDPNFEAIAADAAVRMGNVSAGLAHAQRAMALAADEPRSQSILGQVSLAAGQPERAVAALLPLRERFPNDQHALALLATAWRLLDDPRYRELYDYDAFVGVRRLRPPAGWPDLAAYLVDLAAGLNEAHVYHTHPFGQSLRGGSQASDILNSAHPAIRAFPDAIAAGVTEHLQQLGRGADPVRARNTGRWRIHAAWSVRLRPNGFHADHVHPQGWLSSACYIALPAAVEKADREGWIKFGQPGVPTHPPLGPEHFVKPEPGLLALFPSYMWHGTVPFSGDEPRLTIAFDLLPA